MGAEERAMSEPEAKNAVRPEPIPPRPKLTPEAESRLQEVMSPEFEAGLTAAFAAGKREALRRRDERLAAEAAEDGNAARQADVPSPAGAAG